MPIIRNTKVLAASMRINTISAVMTDSMYAMNFELLLVAVGIHLVNLELIGGTALINSVDLRVCGVIAVVVHLGVLSEVGRYVTMRTQRSRPGESIMAVALVMIFTAMRSGIAEISIMISNTSNMLRLRLLMQTCSWDWSFLRTGTR